MYIVKCTKKTVNLVREPFSFVSLSFFLSIILYLSAPHSGPVPVLLIRSKISYWVICYNWVEYVIVLRINFHIIYIWDDESRACYHRLLKELIILLKSHLAGAEYCPPPCGHRCGDGPPQQPSPAESGSVLLRSHRLHHPHVIRLQRRGAPQPVRRSLGPTPASRGRLRQRSLDVRIPYSLYSQCLVWGGGRARCASTPPENFQNCKLGKLSVVKLY